MTRSFKLFLNWLLPVGLIGAVVVGWRWFIWPAHQKFSEVSHASTNINQKRVRLIEHKTALELLTAQKSQLEDLAGRGLAYLPPSAGVADFVLQLEEMVKSLGLEPTELNVTEDQRAGQAKPAAADELTKPAVKPLASPEPVVIGSSTFNVTMTGSFEQAQQYLNLLETVDRFNTVESLNLTYGTDGLTARLEGKIYHQPLPSFVIKADEPIARLTDQVDQLKKRKHFGDPLSVPTVTEAGSKDPFGKL